MKEERARNKIYLQQTQDLNKQVLAREDYIVSLENENLMLREEIKRAKFFKEKSGYADFTAGLTVLRKEATSHERAVKQQLTSLERSQLRNSYEQARSVDRHSGNASPLKEKIKEKL